jgi:hypothetical protein
MPCNGSPTKVRLVVALESAISSCCRDRASVVSDRSSPGDDLDQRLRRVGVASIGAPVAARATAAISAGDGALPPACSARQHLDGAGRAHRSPAVAALGRQRTAAPGANRRGDLLRTDRLQPRHQLPQPNQRWTVRRDQRCGVLYKDVGKQAFRWWADSGDREPVGVDGVGVRQVLGIWGQGGVCAVGVRAEGRQLGGGQQAA